MGKRGPRSLASLSLVPGSLARVSRLRMPAELTEAQKETWLAAVNGKPADWFGDEHVPILLEYVRHVSTAAILTQQIDAFEPEWLKDDDGLRRFDRLTAMRAREAGVINTLARSMRITHQALYRGETAATAQKDTPRAKPWEFTGTE